MLFPGRLIVDWVFITDYYWIIWIEIYYAVGFYKYAGHPVAGSRDNKRIVKAKFNGAWFYFIVPVGPGANTQTQVPFADGCSLVSRFLQHTGNGRLVGGYNECSVAGRYTSSFFSP